MQMMLVSLIAMLALAVAGLAAYWLFGPKKTRHPEYRRLSEKYHRWDPDGR